MLLQQYIVFLRERGCSRATLAEQADVAIKVVTWLVHDNQLPPGDSNTDAQGHLVLLRRLRHQLRTCLAPSPRKPLGEQVTPEYLTVLLMEAYEEAKAYASGPREKIGVAEAIIIQHVCMATLFWAFVPPLRSSGRKQQHGLPACSCYCLPYLRLLCSFEP